MNNQALESITSEKLLGVVVGQNLTWKGHVAKVHRTVRMLLSTVRHIKHFLPTDAGIKYCQAFIFPTLIIVVQSGDLPNYKYLQAAEKSS